ncbi:MAG: protein kinase, partial [Deltaproteobacteria bacterium]|nr:protein kinase [Deltaproteobacteria bacterium]
MTPCPPAETLLSFAAGNLSDDANASVETHIDACASCRATLSSLAKGSVPAGSFGRYKLETVLGSGGMGIVYRAWDPQLARPVAIKVVRQAGNDAALRARLVREAQSLARLSHPNVCHVYDVGTDGDEVWVAMELIDGTTLRAWAAGHPAQHELLDILLGAAEGIAAAHASGLIHRDIKPENVLVTRSGRPVVTDFGLARVDLPIDPIGSTVSGSADPQLTATGAIAGTPAYLAPEQLTGDTLDARVDQFAWATMAWELLTGVRPFPIIAAVRLDAIRAGLTLPASLPRPVATALARALALAPRDRFPSMRELIDAIRVRPATTSRARLPLIV